MSKGGKKSPFKLSSLVTSFNDDLTSLPSPTMSPKLKQDMYKKFLAEFSVEDPVLTSSPLKITQTTPPGERSDTPSSVPGSVSKNRGSVSCDSDSEGAAEIEALAKVSETCCCCGLGCLMKSSLFRDKVAERRHRQLCLAAEKGNLVEMKICQRNGCSFVHADESGRSVVILAVRSRQYDAVELALKFGGSAETPDNEGLPPIHHAVKKNAVDCLAVLLQWGADVDAPDRAGVTALMRACRQGRLDCVQCLIDFGANLSAADRRGRQTALHFAVKSGKLPVVKLLLEHSVDVGAKDKRGMTCKDIAKRGGDPRLIELFN